MKRGTDVERGEALERVRTRADLLKASLKIGADAAAFALQQAAHGHSPAKIVMSFDVFRGMNPALAAEFESGGWTGPILIEKRPGDKAPTARRCLPEDL